MTQASSATAMRQTDGIPIHRKSVGQRIRENWQLYLMLLIPVVLTIVYKYIPMYGIQIAFQDFKASRGITGSEWVGLYWFERFFTAPNCVRMIKNTVLLSLYSLVMQLQYGPIGVFFTGQDASGKWLSITESEAQAKYNKGTGELKSTHEVWDPKLILSEYYDEYFYMEDRAIEHLTDLSEYWMPFVDDATTYPIDCVFNAEELDTIDLYRADFESAVSEQEVLWLKDGGPSDAEWNAYLEKLSKSYGMDKLLEVY